MILSWITHPGVLIAVAIWFRGCLFSFITQTMISGADQELNTFGKKGKHAGVQSGKQNALHSGKGHENAKE